MANKKSVNANKKIVEKVEEKVVADVQPVDQEKEDLKAQLAELQAQMKLMMQAQANAASTSATPTKRKNIKFISLASGITVLKGNREHVFDEQFQVKSIPETEARAIVTNMDRAISNGLVYIADADFVRDCELDGVYADILSDDDMKTLLIRGSEYACEVYKNANPTQRQIIVDMVEDKKLNGQPIDANILIELGKLCGKDFMSIDTFDEE